ncbi:hypothetical protein MF672_031140 [Actinomadura sp. ATCC 31491]|uniref:DUF397 domain-containing protein n=1 Tax=Actinomadura luzonensis TaxID=2805427 RepID=A0ABT0G0W0_9ACTN|nr:hypothetical protein [Actinomadura luzonensis]MCK2218213.1 hypothetical protein [Actinomadura luzonensis]
MASTTAAEKEVHGVRVQDRQRLPVKDGDVRGFGIGVSAVTMSGTLRSCRLAGGGIAKFSGRSAGVGSDNTSDSFSSWRNDPDGGPVHGAVHVWTDR